MPGLGELLQLPSQIWGSPREADKGRQQLAIDLSLAGIWSGGRRIPLTWSGFGRAAAALAIDETEILLSWATAVSMTTGRAGPGVGAGLVGYHDIYGLTWPLALAQCSLGLASPQIYGK